MRLSGWSWSSIGCAGSGIDTRQRGRRDGRALRARTEFIGNELFGTGRERSDTSIVTGMEGGRMFRYVTVRSGSGQRGIGTGSVALRRTMWIPSNSNYEGL
jgi:hypothetical protein